METKHTPGPWKAFPSGVYGTNRSGLCVARRHQEEKDDQQWAANAQLIAAAPELLAALAECVSEPGAKCWDDNESTYRRLRAINDIARAAIARATGQAEAVPQ